MGTGLNLSLRPCLASSSLPSLHHFPTRPPFRVCCSSRLEQTLTQIHNSGVIACLRASRMGKLSLGSGSISTISVKELAFDAASAALCGGISVLEIVMSTPGVLEVLPLLMRDHPSKIIGVGTVLNAHDAKSAIDIGARFLMSPAMVKDILDDVKSKEVLYIPGVMTPTEILYAYTSGAKIVKIYPVSALGGVRYISALNRPFPHIPMVASQGITLDSIQEYITHGASSVVLSDAIFDKEAMSQRNFHTINKFAQLAASLGNEAVERRRIMLK